MRIIKMCHSTNYCIKKMPNKANTRTPLLEGRKYQSCSEPSTDSQLAIKD